MNSLLLLENEFDYILLLLSRHQVISDSATTWTAACQVSLSLTIPRCLPKFMSIASVMSSNHLILCHPLLLLRSIFPSIMAFSNELVVPSGGQSIGASASASASVLSMNTQHQFPLGFTSLISLLSKGLSRVFSSITVQIVSSSALSLLYGPTFTLIYDYWRNQF